MGYGSQGHAHAQNLKDSGCQGHRRPAQGMAHRGRRPRRPASRSRIANAVKGADVVMILLPDENIPAVYYNDVEPNIKKGAALAFAHGFNVITTRSCRVPTST